VQRGHHSSELLNLNRPRRYQFPMKQASAQVDKRRSQIKGIKPSLNPKESLKLSPIYFYPSVTIYLPL
jgi:hypothetical protein